MFKRVVALEDILEYYFENHKEQIMDHKRFHFHHSGAAAIAARNANMDLHFRGAAQFRIRVKTGPLQLRSGSDADNLRPRELGYGR